MRSTHLIEMYIHVVLHNPTALVEVRSTSVCDLKHKQPSLVEVKPDMVFYFQTSYLGVCLERKFPSKHPVVICLNFQFLFSMVLYNWGYFTCTDSGKKVSVDMVLLQLNASPFSVFCTADVPYTLIHSLEREPR